MTEQENIFDQRNQNKPSSDFDHVQGLIKECIAGNRRSQKALYEKYSPFIYGVIRRYVPNTNIAQEILNDAFYKILTRLSQYSFKGAFEGWMRRIVVNIITDHFRKEFTNKEAYKVDIDTYDAYVDSDSIGKISYKELLDVVHSLPDTQRTVFNLFVFENFSHKEISEQLGISENNSRWQLMKVQSLVMIVVVE